MIIEPQETNVAPGGHPHPNVGEQATIVAIPDADRIQRDRRDSITLRREFRCDDPIVVRESSDSFAGRDVPDSGGVVPRRGDKLSRVGREIDRSDHDGCIVPVREHSLIRYCVPDENKAQVGPRCDPSAIYRDSETLHVLRFHR